MRNLKKFLALVLAFMMAMSLMLTVNAKNVEFNDGSKVNTAFVEDITVLAGMGVIKGVTTSEFQPQAPVTRAEMAAIVYRLVTGDANDRLTYAYAGYGDFTDVTADKWYAGYVGYCANAGIIKGYGDGRFGPSNPVTGYEALVMLLRAMGYDQPDEFSGSNWRQHAASIATQRGMLAKVNKTRYEGTLSQGATREFAAEVAFQAATKAMVQYTAAFGYQTTGMTGGLLNTVTNPSLGERWYGLTDMTSVIVGNQATGEGATRLGFGYNEVDVQNRVLDQFGNPIIVQFTGTDRTEVDSYIYSYKADSTANADYTTAKTTLDAAITAGTNNTVYAYLTRTSQVWMESADYEYGALNTKFNFDTGLDLFGHKVTAWYDYRDFSSSTGYKTYAILDKASLAETVWADNLTNDDSVSGKFSVYSAAVAAGFSDRSTTVYESDRFSQMGKDTDNQAVQSKVGMYTLISNNNDKTVDVVISLNQEVAQITQRNSTIKGGEYIYLGKGSSKFGTTLDASNNGKILDTLLAPGSDKTLGDVVTANEIVGTTQTNMTGDKASNNDNPRTLANAASVPTQFCRYETSKLEPAFTGTIATYKLADTADTTSRVKIVNLNDGTSYGLSGITGADINVSTQTEWNFDSATHLIDGALGTLRGNNTAAGMTYTFYTDAVGRFIGVQAANEYEFLYTTFADYEIGALGTGTIGYYAYGVDWDGNIVKTNNQIKSITLPVNGDGDTLDPTGIASMSGKWSSGTPGARTFSNAGLATGYNLLPVTMKDQGSVNAGNQIKNGANTRFLMDGEGNMTWYPVSGAKNGNRFIDWYDTNKSSTSYTWTITANDVRNGFARVYSTKLNSTTSMPETASAANNVDYLLTDSTKFIVVTGSGTSDLSVKIYNGLNELVAGGSSAEIVSNPTSGDNVYFITGEQRYGNVDTDANRTIDTVILSNSNLRQYGVQDLFFSAPGNAPTGVKLASDPADVYQYELYNNGEKETYFIQGGGADNDLYVGYDQDNPALGTSGQGDFYTLVEIDNVDGQPIYRAMRVTNAANSNLVNQAYNYIVVNNVNTADIGGNVFKVGSSIVAEAYGDNATGVASVFPNGTNGIDTVEKLNNAVSMGKAGASGDYYNVSVAIVYSGIDVSCIYVTNIAAG